MKMVYVGQQSFACQSTSVWNKERLIAVEFFEQA